MMKLLNTIQKWTGIMMSDFNQRIDLLST